MLREEQFHAAGIHSMKVQEYRFRAMRAFKEGQLDILVGTDLISRGIGMQHTLLTNYARCDRLQKCYYL